MEEKKGWKKLNSKSGYARFERQIKTLRGRYGRIDILIEEIGDMVSIIEIKATDWDQILSHRIRATILRHSRQVWKYVEPFVEQGMDVCPGIIYSKAPKNIELKRTIEDGLNERGMQVVWRCDKSS